MSLLIRRRRTDAPSALIPPPGRRAVRLGAAVAVLSVAAGTAMTLPADAGSVDPRAPRTEPGGPLVRTASGSLQGQDDGTAWRFRGIPYAAAPVGGLRWRAPQAAPRWEGVRKATAFAPSCAQTASPPIGVASTSEDCLYLNVYAPRPRAGRPSPVMVWLHGGGLSSGRSDDYDPAPLVRAGVTVVTVNYRLGTLGFLSHPALADGPGRSSGNYGFMDQQAALRWVQRNIAAFGADPRDVTLFGQSAGGYSVLAQLASGTAKGLLTRAIVQSGAYNAGSYGLDLPSRTDAERDGRTVASQLGCPDQTASCLRRLPVEKLLTVTDYRLFRPSIDGAVLARSLRSAFSTGRFNQVPLMIGTNRDEYRLAVSMMAAGGVTVTADTYLPLIQSILGVPSQTARSVAARYPLSDYPSPALALAALGTDWQYACATDEVERAVSRFVPTYAYEFADENVPNRLAPGSTFPYGAAHGFELQYLFTLAFAQGPGTLTEDQQRLVRTMQGYWTSFASRGSPAEAGQPGWPRYSVADPKVLTLTPPRPAATTGYAARHQCGLWSRIG